MKKICRTIKLRKFKTKLNEESLKDIEGTEFIVCFSNNKWLYAWGKEDLRSLLERDHINPISRIFDMTDRITINRDVLIDVDEVVK